MDAAGEDTMDEDTEDEDVAGEYPEGRDAEKHHRLYCSHPAELLQYHSAELMASHDSQFAWCPVQATRS